MIRTSPPGVWPTELRNPHQDLLRLEQAARYANGIYSLLLHRENTILWKLVAFSLAFSNLFCVSAVWVDGGQAGQLSVACFDAFRVVTIDTPSSSEISIVSNLLGAAIVCFCFDSTLSHDFHPRTKVNIHTDVASCLYHAFLMLNKQSVRVFVYHNCLVAARGCQPQKSHRDVVCCWPIHGTSVGMPHFTSTS